MEKQRIRSIEKRKGKMAGINPTISTVTLNVNGFKNPDKGQRLPDSI